MYGEDVSGAVDVIRHQCGAMHKDMARAKKVVPPVLHCNETERRASKKMRKAITFSQPAERTTSNYIVKSSASANTIAPPFQNSCANARPEFGRDIAKQRKQRKQRKTEMRLPAGCISRERSQGSVRNSRCPVRTT